MAWRERGKGREEGKARQVEPSRAEHFVSSWCLLWYIHLDKVLYNII